MVPISLVNKDKALPTRVLGEIILRSLTTDCCRPKRGVFLTEKIHRNNSRHPGVYFPLFAVADLRFGCVIYSYFTRGYQMSEKTLHPVVAATRPLCSAETVDPGDYCRMGWN